MNGIESLFINSIAAIAVTAIFIWYLAKVVMPHIYQKDCDMKDIIQSFNNTVQNQLDQANKVIKDNTQSQIKAAETIQKLADCIQAINRKTKKTEK